MIASAASRLGKTRPSFLEAIHDAWNLRSPLIWGVTKRSLRFQSACNLTSIHPGVSKLHFTHEETVVALTGRCHSPFLDSGCHQGLIDFPCSEVWLGSGRRFGLKRRHTGRYPHNGSLMAAGILLIALRAKIASRLHLCGILLRLGANQHQFPPSSTAQ